jgi:hypothetical protein
VSPRLHERLQRRAPSVVAVDRQDLAWTDQDDSGVWSPESCSYRGGADQPAGEAFRRLHATLPAGSALDVIAGNDLTVHWVQTPPVDLASLGELQRIARARCAHLYGGAPADWIVAGDWDAQHPFVCAALPRAAVTDLDRRFAPHKCRTRWHTSWSIATCAATASFPRDGWCVMRTPQRLLLWHCRAARVDCMAGLAIDRAHNTACLATMARQQIQIELARAERSPADVLHWLDLVAGYGIPVKAAGMDGIVMVKSPKATAAVTSPHRTEALAALALGPLLGRGAR